MKDGVTVININAAKIVSSDLTKGNLKFMVKGNLTVITSSIVICQVFIFSFKHS
jgi:hypothetical protein